MSPGQRSDRGGGAGSRPWLVAVVVFSIVGAIAPVTAGVGAVGMMDSSAAAVDGLPDGGSASAADAPADPEHENPALQQGISGTLPLGDADTRIVGEATNDTLGASMTMAGDVNGDGVNDVLVAAPRNNSGGENAGAVYLFYGPIDAGDISAGNADATFVGESAGDRAGYAVGAGDVNGDGLSDLVVGAPLNDDAAPSAGAAYVVHGGDHGGTMSLANADAKLTGEAEGRWRMPTRS